MHEQPMNVPKNCISAYEVVPKAVLRANRLGLTLTQVFEPGRFSASLTGISAGYLLTILATDGWCEALVASVDDRGRLELQTASAPPVAAPETSRRRVAA